MDDLRTIRYFQDYPAAMRTFETLATSTARNLEAAYVPELAAEFGIPSTTVLIRYQGGEPLAAIESDGSTILLLHSD